MTKKYQEILQIRVLQIICDISALFTHEAGEDNEEIHSTVSVYWDVFNKDMTYYIFL